MMTALPPATKLQFFKDLFSTKRCLTSWKPLESNKLQYLVMFTPQCPSFLVLHILGKQIFQLTIVVFEKLF
jgi:hypothetical protein